MPWKTDFDEKIEKILSGESEKYISGPADAVRDLLSELFPWYKIFSEYFCWYKNTKLFFDFYIKDLNLLIEVQGRQHYEFVEHFHGDRKGFLESKKRDNLKREYCQENSLTLIEIKYNEIPVTAGDMLKIINRALGEENGS